MQKKNSKLIKSILIMLILIIIILGLIITKKTQLPQTMNEQAKAEYTTQIGSQSYDITNAVTEAPNAPSVSAGMIPIKWDGTNWIITTQDDSKWYNYAQGKPAYVMLNDGTYQSEMIQNMKNKKLAKENKDTKIQENELGSIYMWLPRFAYNEQGEILYIKQCYSIAGSWTIPEIFTYEISIENKGDLSLSGVWVEYNPLNNESIVTEKINNMTGEENKYGFIANTKSTAMTQTEQSSIKMYIDKINTNTEGGNVLNNQLNDITNLNRTILKITNANKLEPIKENIYYDKNEEKIKIEVLYRTNEISKILDTKGNILSENSTIADTGDAVIGNRTYDYVIIDNQNNQKKVSITITGLDVYIIENEEELKIFRNAVNAGKTTANTKAYQIADVKMNEGKYTVNNETGDIAFSGNAEQWIPIGNKPRYYTGKYYGNNHKISGVYINNNSDYQGLFGYMRGGYIQGIKLVNSYIKGKGYVGGIVGGTDAYSNNIVIVNCANEGKVQASGSYIGGIIGLALKYTNINNCYNSGTISSTSYHVGGIVGRSEEYTNINNCYNVGTISSTTQYVGGIVGILSHGSNISNCYNVGKVSSSSRFVGGIVGRNQYSAINKCYNMGPINGFDNLGGITGYHDSADGYSTYISNCVNATEAISGKKGGAICGNRSSGSISSSKYLKTSSSLNGIGVISGGNVNYGCTAYSSLSSMPTILSVVNGSNAFVEDTEGINNGYPILVWQVE